MYFRCLSLLTAMGVSLFAAGRPVLPVLKVCADPDNMPFSNQLGQGFENKLAELVAGELGARLQYTWWPERKSSVEKSLGLGKCDVLLGVPAAIQSVITTRPYYQSTYVFVSRRDRNLHISSLADPRLSDLRIGIQIVGDDYAPPAYALARRGITRNVVGYSLFSDSEPNSQAKILNAVAGGDVDVAIVWGPSAGYFARSETVPLDIEPITPPAFFGVSFRYQIALAVRKEDNRLRDELDRVLEKDTGAIRRILNDYGVPQVP
jgi:mxaJ protein